MNPEQDAPEPEIAAFFSRFRENTMAGVMKWIKSAMDTRDYFNRDTREYETLYIIPDASTSDDVSAVYTSNGQALLEWYPQFVEEHGSQVVVPESKLNLFTVVTKEFKEFQRTIDGMENYTVLDEMRMGQIEHERQQDAWKNWASREFTRDLERMFEEEIGTTSNPDAFQDALDEWSSDDSKVYQFFESLRDSSNTYWEEQSDGGQVINIERILKEVDWDMFHNEIMGEPAVYHDPRQMRFPFPESRELAESLAFAILEGYDFSCLMANLPADTAHRIIAWGKRYIKDEHLFVDEEGGKGRETEIHVTVKYGLLDSVPTRELLDVIGSTEPFEIQLAPATLFEQDDYDVLKLDVISPELRDLNRKVCRAAPYYDTHPVYHPHVTVAYLKKGMGDHLVGHHPFESEEKLGATTLAKDGLVEISSVLFSPSGGGRKQELILGTQPEVVTA